MKTGKKLDVDETAAELGVSKFTIRRWIVERKIPFFRVGGRIVFDKSDLDSFLARSRVEALGSGKRERDSSYD